MSKKKDKKLYTTIVVQINGEEYGEEYLAFGRALSKLSKKDIVRVSGVAKPTKDIGKVWNKLESNPKLKFVEDVATSDAENYTLRLRRILGGN